MTIAARGDFEEGFLVQGKHGKRAGANLVHQLPPSRLSPPELLLLS
jgi:hypothetical protein